MPKKMFFSLFYHAQMQKMPQRINAAYAPHLRRSRPFSCRSPDWTQAFAGSHQCPYTTIQTDVSVYVHMLSARELLHCYFANIMCTQMRLFMTVMHKGYEYSQRHSAHMHVSARTHRQACRCHCRAAGVTISIHSERKWGFN